MSFTNTSTLFHQTTPSPVIFDGSILDTIEYTRKYQLLCVTNILIGSVVIDEHHLPQGDSTKMPEFGVFLFQRLVYGEA